MLTVSVRIYAPRCCQSHAGGAASVSKIFLITALRSLPCAGFFNLWLTVLCCDSLFSTACSGCWRLTLFVECYDIAEVAHFICYSPLVVVAGVAHFKSQLCALGVVGTHWAVSAVYSENGMICGEQLALAHTHTGRTVCESTQQ